MTFLLASTAISVTGERSRDITHEDGFAVGPVDAGVAVEIVPKFPLLAYTGR